MEILGRVAVRDFVLLRQVEELIDADPQDFRRAALGYRPLAEGGQHPLQAQPMETE